MERLGGRSSQSVGRCGESLVCSEKPEPSCGVIGSGERSPGPDHGACNRTLSEGC